MTIVAAQTSKPVVYEELQVPQAFQLQRQKNGSLFWYRLISLHLYSLITTMHSNGL